MKTIILAAIFIISLPCLSQAQTKKPKDLFAGFPDANTWQADESYVKAGKGFFINKMVLKTNTDVPQDMYVVDEKGKQNDKQAIDATISVADPAKQDATAVSNAGIK